MMGNKVKKGRKDRWADEGLVTEEGVKGSAG